ncbi:hypothetical protein MG293_001096 [Ovis ammon polii]|uniref:Ig-like domain-containing protein n=1 Tax=Ovis ammon polii TaxID=230172 RepID=A0AAD4UMG5_OVIAM|nr:hypothetical protein MG293_001096 [Ovis ammon polii]
MDCSLSGSSVCGIFQARVLEGGAIAFMQNRRSLTWFYTTDQKIVEWESGEPTKYFDTKFKDRATLDSQSGTLHIRKVEKEDSSTYLLRVLKDNGHEEEYKISLMVLDPVPKPKINVNMTQKMNTCHLTLSCGIQDQSVTYTWYWESGSFPKQLQSSVLEDVHTPESYSKSYTCQVSNPISRQNDTIHFTSPCVQGYSKYATPGDNVSLQISNLPMKNRSLAWFYTTDQKIVERESGEPTKYFDTKFKDRATLDSQSGTLHIRKVQKEDSSTYLLRVLKDNGHEEEYKISLMVLDPVPKPEINVNMTQKMNTCNLTLSCGIQGHSVTYTWYWESGSFPKQLQSSVLEDVHTPESYSKSYTCQVSNPISRQNNTIHFTSPCVQDSIALNRIRAGTDVGNLVKSFEVGNLISTDQINELIMGSK